MPDRRRPPAHDVIEIFLRLSPTFFVFLSSLSYFSLREVGSSLSTPALFLSPLFVLSLPVGLIDSDSPCQ